MPDIKFELIRYRIEKAYSKLSTARDLIRTNHFADSVGASYYAIFSSIRALLMIKGINPKTHEGAIKQFNLHFIRDKKFPQTANKIIREAKLIREHSDYGDFFIVERQTAEMYIEESEKFIKRCEEVLTEILLKDEKPNGKNGKK